MICSCSSRIILVVKRSWVTAAKMRGPVDEVRRAKTNEKVALIERRCQDDKFGWQQVATGGGKNLHCRLHCNHNSGFLPAHANILREEVRQLKTVVGGGKK